MKSADACSKLNPLRFAPCFRLACFWSSHTSEMRVSLVALAGAKSGPGLKDFLQRAKVLHTYRDFLRLAFQLPLDTREEVVNQIQAEFRLNATAVDSYSQRAAMAEASRQRKILASYVATATTREVGTPIPKFAGDRAAAPTSAAASTDGRSGVTVTHTSHSQASTPSEYEGRIVGHGWPWARPVRADEQDSSRPEDHGATANAAPVETGTGPARHFRELYKHRLPEL